jgi:hypothetical protein
MVVRILALAVLAAIAPLGPLAADQGKAEKQPVLLIDGEGAQGRKAGDSFYVATALKVISETPYAISFGDELAEGDAAKALQRDDLAKFKSIYLFNVPELTAAQLANLEKYVEAGGGLVVFLGPHVSSAWYNKHFYKLGKGLFPAPLKETFQPPADKAAPEPEYTGEYQLLLREDLFPDWKTYPIFGPIFENPRARDLLKFLGVKRYFPIARAKGSPDPRPCRELANLPNQNPAADFARPVTELLARMKDVFDADKGLNPAYGKSLQEYAAAVKPMLAGGSDKTAIQLSKVLEKLLTDPGSDKGGKVAPPWKDFWSNADPKIAGLARDLRQLMSLTRDGDPLFMSCDHGKGRVVVVFTTAGKEWNSWVAGATAALVFPALIAEMQRYVSGESKKETPK